MKIIRSQSASPSYNLALEEYLFLEFQEDFLLFYVNDKSVILGSNQSVRNEVNVDFCKANNIEIVRRKSGGGAVYHDAGNLNFSFITNKNGNNNSLSGNFLKPVVAWLQEAGVPAVVGERKDLWLPDGYKITGTASHIRKNRELHHGTLLVDADLTLLAKALYVERVDKEVKATPSVRSKTKNIHTCLEEQNLKAIDSVAFMELIVNLSERFYNVKRLTDSDLNAALIQNYQHHYIDDTWTFRK